MAHFGEACVQQQQQANDEWMSTRIMKLAPGEHTENVKIITNLGMLVSKIRIN